MSRRRKRAPPMRMNEEQKKQLCWNMHDDQKNDMLDVDDMAEDHPVAGTSSSSAVHIVINDDSRDEDLTRKEKNPKSPNILTLVDEAEDSCHLLPSIAIQLNILILPYQPDPPWKTLLGEFTLQLLSEQHLSDNIQKRVLTLMTAEFSDHLHLLVHVNDIKVDKGEESLQSTYELDVLVESSLNNEIMENLMWLQKKKIIVLYQRSGDTCSVKVVNLYN